MKLHFFLFDSIYRYEYTLLTFVHCSNWHLLCVGLVPSALLHEPLVGPEPGVGGRNALLLLIQLAGEPAIQ